MDQVLSVNGTAATGPRGRWRVAGIGVLLAGMVGLFTILGVAPAAHAAPVTTVTDEAGLASALANMTGDAQIALGASFSTGQLLAKATHTLDLAGYTLTTSNIILDPATSTSPGADLTIEDTSHPSTGKLIAGLVAETPGITTTGATLTIEGGTVTATADGVAAGIGGSGYFGGDPSGGTVVINGGTVIAIGGATAAGIGGGLDGSGGKISITNGTVTATGSGGGAGIGGGPEGDGGTISISGGTVTANGGSGGAGIGSGSKRPGGTISISNGTVTAIGGDAGAGIGGGFFAAGGTISISGGAVTATGGTSGGEGAAGIGGGLEGAGGQVRIGADAAVTVSTSDNPNGVIGAGQGGSGFGSLTVDGTLRVKPGSQLVVPAGVTVHGDGLKTGSGAIVNNGIILTSADPVASDWTVSNHNYPVTLDSNYPGGPAATTTHVYAPTMTAGARTLPTAPRRAGYAFTGWNTAADGSGTAFTADTALATDPTVYAQWDFAGAAPQITSGPPPAGTVGTVYTFPVTATGNPAPTFAVSSGALPTGLTLVTATGKISGTPTTAGTFTFAITASNTVGSDVSDTYTVRIMTAAITPSAPVSPTTSLANTGSDVALSGVAGLLTILIGAGLLLIGRRPRTRRQ